MINLFLPTAIAAAITPHEAQDQLALPVWKFISLLLISNT
jgi:hypothetical protein